ncbi:MAG TPA: replication-associated recombination protein A [Chloroflexota bacterium]|jgi:putative ATPase
MRSSSRVQGALFESDSPITGEPLAARLRPHSLDDFVGQEHIIGPGRVLRAAIERDQLSSIILWGPPGSGKTTLAEIIARITSSNFVSLSAVSSGVADLRRVIDEAAKLRRANIRTVLFIDEIHRFSKSQQDAVLQAVENGAVTLIGATTENPSFEVNSALLSRCRVFTLKPLTDEQLDAIVVRGLAELGASIEGEARQFLVTMAHGDARVALNALELASVATSAAVTLAAVEDALQHRALLYDRQGDQHYDVISAFIKSVRGSDPDAAVYWLARMLEAGEDPLFVVRRMVILAAEDIGLADPLALSVAVAAQQAVHFIGMPEGFLPLAEAALYLALAPKSNSALRAYAAARKDVETTGSQPVPLHLRNATTGLMVHEGYGRGYMYAHDYTAALSEAGAELPPSQRLQEYLPQDLAGHRYYQPGTAGQEAKFKRWIEERRDR